MNYLRRRGISNIEGLECLVTEKDRIELFVKVKEPNVRPVYYNVGTIKLTNRNQPVYFNSRTNSTILNILETQNQPVEIFVEEETPARDYNFSYGWVQYAGMKAFLDFMGIADKKIRVLAYNGKEEKNKRIEIHVCQDETQLSGDVLFTIHLGRNNRPDRVEKLERLILAEVLYEQKQIKRAQLLDYCRFVDEAKNSVVLTQNTYEKYQCGNVVYLDIQSFFKFKGITCAKAVAHISDDRNKRIEMQCTLGKSTIIYTVELNKENRPIGINKIALDANEGVTYISLVEILHYQGWIDDKEYAAFQKYKAQTCRRVHRQSAPSLKRTTELNQKSYDYLLAGLRYTEIAPFLRFKGVTNATAKVCADKTGRRLEIRDNEDDRGLVCSIHLNGENRACGVDDNTESVSLVEVLHDQGSMDEDEYKEFRQHRKQSNRRLKRREFVQRRGEIILTQYSESYYFARLEYSGIDSFLRFKNIAYANAIVHISENTKTLELRCALADDTGWAQENNTVTYLIELNDNLRPSNVGDGVTKKPLVEILHDQGQVDNIEYGAFKEYKARNSSRAKRLTWAWNRNAVILTQDAAGYCFGSLSYECIATFLKFKNVDSMTAEYIVDNDGKRYIKLENQQEDNGFSYLIELNKDLRPVGMEDVGRHVALIEVLREQGIISAEEYAEFKQFISTAYAMGGYAAREARAAASLNRLKEEVYALELGNPLFKREIAEKFLRELESGDIKVETAAAFFSMTGKRKVSDLQKPGWYIIWRRAAALIRDNNLLDYRADGNHYTPPPAIEFLFDLLPSENDPLPDDNAVAELYFKAMQGDKKTRDELAAELMRFTAQVFLDMLKASDAYFYMSSEYYSDRFYAICEAVLSVIRNNTWNKQRYPSLYDYIEDEVIIEAIDSDRKSRQKIRYKEIPAEDLSYRKDPESFDDNNVSFIDNVPHAAASGEPITPLSFLDTAAPIEQLLHYDPEAIFDFNEKRTIAIDLKRFLSDTGIQAQIKRMLNNRDYAVFIVGSLGAYGNAIKDDVNLNIMIVVDEAESSDISAVSKVLRVHFNGVLEQKNSLLILGQDGAYFDELQNGNGFISFLLNHHIGSLRNGFFTAETISTNGASTPHAKARAFLHLAVPLGEKNMPNAILVYESKPGMRTRLKSRLRGVLKDYPNIAFSTMVHSLEVFRDKQQAKDHGKTYGWSCSDLTVETHLATDLTEEQRVKHGTEDLYSDFATAMLRTESNDMPTATAVAVSFAPCVVDTAA
ncbi:MAG: hypothetical protein JW946_00195 [Candidatus Omnitrophica bacterium]|nr:hypothetical protein [Candidatus Omnitrophota bacterium]